MRKSGSLFFLFAAFCLLFNLKHAFAQSSKKELESRKKQLQQEIKTANNLLKETKKNKRLSLSQLVALNNKISKREEMIATINAELGQLSGQISENEREIARLQAELTKLKKEYGEMVYVAWKNRDAYNKLMFLFASSDFNQAYKRLRYFQQYSDFRKIQARMIDSTKATIEKRNLDLSQKKTEKNSLLGSQENEKIELKKEKTEKEEALVGLQKREAELKQDLKKKQADAGKLNTAIKRIIEQEIRKAREEAQKLANAEKAKAESSPGTSSKKKTGPASETPKPAPEPALKLTPEAELISANFASNRNRLPWPVTEGVISGWFGEHDHPVLKGIKVKNNGIDITTRPGATSRAVFDGEVSGVVNIPGAGTAIILRHGEYLSVYSNLAESYVKRGDKVKIKQSIGSVMSDGDGKSEIHFEIWKGSVIQNPSSWIHN